MPQKNFDPEPMNGFQKRKSNPNFLESLENFLKEAQCVFKQINFIPDNMLTGTEFLSLSNRCTLFVHMDKKPVAFKRMLISGIKAICMLKVKSKLSEEVWIDDYLPIKASRHIFEVNQNVIQVLILHQCSYKEFYSAYEKFTELKLVLLKKKPYIPEETLGI